MSNNVYRFDRKAIEQRENIRLLGELLQSCYDLGLEPDPEMDEWLKKAEQAIQQKIIIRC